MATSDHPETISVETQKIYCDGGDGPLGHPRVFLVINQDGFVDCPYCDRHYVLAAGAKRAAH